MEFISIFFFKTINAGLMAGLVTVAFLVLRPLMLRIFTGQQRLVIWMMAWALGYFPTAQGYYSPFPVTFQDLVVPRTGGFYSRGPAFVPESYEGPGTYHLALPGKGLVPVELTDVLLGGAILVWLLGAAALCLFFVRHEKRLTAQVRQGQKLPKDHPLLAAHPLKESAFLKGTVDVWVVPGLPTSFVRRTPPWEYDTGYEVCLQAELPPEQMELVLIHEMRHISLWHCWWKVVGTVSLVTFWWNPLVWLGFRYFCRDMEMACDESVLKRLDPARRKEYARVLVELGAGKRLWDVPLAFGECDAALRVKHVAGWRPRKRGLAVVTWCAAMCAVFFFHGGQQRPCPAADLVLAYQRAGGMAQFVQQLDREMTQALGAELDIVQVWEGPNKTLAVRQLVPGQINYSDHDKMIEIANGGGTYKTVTKTCATLFVNTADGTWYQVYHDWNGVSTGYLDLEGVEACEAPNLTGRYQVIG